MRKPPLSACSRLLLLTLLAGVALVAPELGASHSLPATSAEKTRGLEGQLSHHKRNLHHAVTGMKWCQTHRRLFKGKAGSACYWPHYRLARRSNRKIAKLQRRLIPSGWPGLPRPPSHVASAILRVFGPGRYAQAQCISYYESHYTTNLVSVTSDYGIFQINYPSWSGTFDFSRMFDPWYNALAAYRISSGGRNWNPWVVYWKWGVCH